MPSTRRHISYFPAFLSITLVMFLAGLFGLFLLHAGRLKKEIKENIQLNIYFKDDAGEADLTRIRTSLENEPFVLNARFVSKDEALRLWNEKLGENPQKLLGFNPFPNSVDVRFKEDFVNSQNLESLKAKLEQMPQVREISYDSGIVKNIDRNIRMAALILLSIAAIMTLVSITLINNTIRLTLYAKRFIIKSMQFVGATQGFIRKPFIIRGIVLGLCSGIFSCLLILGALSVVIHYFPILTALESTFGIILLLAGIILVGVLISAVSSYFAINKYMKMKLDELF